MMDSKGKAPVSPRNAPYHEHQDSDSDSLSDIEEDARLLIDTYLPPLHPSTATEKARFPSLPLYSELPGSTSILPLPLCIPQTGTTATAPFVRAYNPEIGISVEEFMGFVDGLNLAMTSSPPLRIVDVAGQIIGFVPYHWAMWAGAAMQASAQTAMRVLSKTLTDRYLRSANERIFHPRGLSARICTTPAALKLISPSTNMGVGEGPSKLDKFGRAVGGVLLQLPLPLTKKIVRAVADKPPPIPIAPGTSDPTGQSSNTMILVRRRLALVEGKALPLQPDGLPEMVRTGFMEKMNAYGLKMDERNLEKKQRKVEERRMELSAIRSHSDNRGVESHLHASSSRGTMESSAQSQRDIGRGVDEKEDGRAARKERKREGEEEGQERKEWKHETKEEKQERKKQEKEEKRERKDHRKEEKHERKEQKKEEKHERKEQKMEQKHERKAEKKANRLERRIADADLLEHWKNSDVLWIVVMDRRFDQGIEGVDKADSQANEEQVDDRMWREELEYERKTDQKARNEYS